MRISHSKIETYKQCPRKYKYKYIEKLEKDVTHSPLLFGGALDNALNYVLSCVMKERAIKEPVAQWIFLKHMKKWHGQNPLSFFKNEQPPGIDNPTEQQVWDNLCYVGSKMITTYISEILPSFKKIINVQIRKDIPNDDGDVLVMIADFIAELNDGTTAVMDNKSSSKPYPKDCVKDSPQLAIYGEQLEQTNGGYVVLEKKLKDDKVVWKIHVDKIEETKVSSVYDDMSEVVGQIKAEVFPKNEKSCYAYGKQCDYYLLCKHNKRKGLKQRD